MNSKTLSLLGNKLLSDAKHGAEEDAMRLQPTNVGLPGNRGTSKRPDKRGRVSQPNSKWCEHGESVNIVFSPEVVVSIDNTVKTIFPVPGPAH